MRHSTKTSLSHLSLIFSILFECLSICVISCLYMYSIKIIKVKWVLSWYQNRYNNLVICHSKSPRFHMKLELGLPLNPDTLFIRTIRVHPHFCPDRGGRLYRYSSIPMKTVFRYNSTIVLYRFITNGFQI